MQVPKLEGDEVPGGVSVLFWYDTPVTNALRNFMQLGKMSKSVIIRVVSFANLLLSCPI